MWTVCESQSIFTGTTTALGSLWNKTKHSKTVGIKKCI